MLLKKLIRAGVPAPLVLALGAGWLWVTYLDFSSQVVRPGTVDTEVVLRYYDRDLRFTEAVERSNPYVKWISGAEDEDDWLKESQANIRKTYLADLGEDGDAILSVIALRLGNAADPPGPSGATESPSETKEELLSGDRNAWDFELFLDQRDDPEIRKIYQEENDRLLDRAMWSSNFDNAVIVIGLGLTAYFLFRPKRDPEPGSRVPDSWAASSVLAAFFLSELLLKPWLLFLDKAYDTYYSLGATFDAYLIYDALWRAFPAFLVALLFLKYPRRIGRVFGLKKRINWLLIIAALAVVSSVDWLLYLVAPATETDPTDFIETTSHDLDLFISLLISSVILAPVFEEFAFRGFLFQGLKSKMGIWAAAGLSSALFAVVHTQYDVWGWISVGTMGLVACYLTHRTGSLKTAIAFHAIGNLLISLDVYFFYQLPL